MFTKELLNATSIAVVLAVVGASGCSKAIVGAGKPVAGKPVAGKPVEPRERVASPVDPTAPPLDIKTPPADAVKTASGVIYKKLVTNAAGTAPQRNDTLMVKYTMWRQGTGEVLFTNMLRPFSLANIAPELSEVLQTFKKGEKAIIWMPAVPAAVAQRHPQLSGQIDVYELEVIDIEPALPIPADLKAPPADAQTLKSGTKYVVVAPGSSNKIRSFDFVTYHVTAWDSDGRMFSSTTEPRTERPFRAAVTAPPLEEVLTSMTDFAIVRFWIDADKMPFHGNRLWPNPTGLVVYQVEIVNVESGVAPPPAAPRDVAKPPPGAKKTPKGAFYRVLKAGKRGPKPTPVASATVNYTGWTTDGKILDSSVPSGEPTEFELDVVGEGWKEIVQVMSIGDQTRFWIPENLGCDSVPCVPGGMVVFDVELVEVKPKP